MEDGKITVNINSIKSLYIDIFYNEIKLASATGFLVNKENDLYLITNRHVVTGRNNEDGQCLDSNMAIPNKLQVLFPHFKDGYYVWSNINIELYKEEIPIWLEHPFYKDKVDVVAIYFGKYNQFQFCHNLIYDYKPIVTENVFIIGYPFGFNVNPNDGRYAIWSTGTVASDPDLNLNINNEQLPAFLVDAKTRHGQSGSPVIYFKNAGMIRQQDGSHTWQSNATFGIGIYSGRINKDSDLGYVWKWHLIKEIIDNHKK